MSYSPDITVADGVTDTFSITFPYIVQSHVYVYLDGVETSAFTWLTSSSIKFDSVPAAGVTITRKRITPRDSRLVDFQDASSLTEAQLDESALQMFYLAQEAFYEASESVNLDDTDDKMDALSKVIKNVADPVNDQDAATKKYGDDNWGGAAATNSAASAAAALDSETAAAVSETNAAASAIAAAASFADFSGAFYGPYASDPATDPNGNPITAGDVYLNTTTGKLMVYVGGAWVDTLTGAAVLGGGNTFSGDQVLNGQVVVNNGNSTSLFVKQSSSAPWSLILRRDDLGPGQDVKLMNRGAILLVAGDLQIHTGYNLVLDHDPTAPLQAASKQYVDARGVTTGTPYVENPMTSLGGTRTWAHGLGATPDRVKIEMECLATDGGFAVGDVITLTQFNYPFASYGHDSTIVKWDATNVSFIANPGASICNATGSGNFIPVASKWKLTLTPYKFG